MMMRRLVFLCFVLSAGILILAACGGAPAIGVDPAQLDLGEISSTAPVSGTLRLTNTGTGVLKLGDLRTSCGCTSAVAAQSTLAAGASTELTITFDPLTHPGLYGPVMRIVYVVSNAGADLEIPVYVTVLSPKEGTP